MHFCKPCNFASRAFFANHAIFQPGILFNITGGGPDPAALLAPHHAAELQTIRKSNNSVRSIIERFLDNMARQPYNSIVALNSCIRAVGATFVNAFAGVVQW